MIVKSILRKIYINGKKYMNKEKENLDVYLEIF